MEALKLKTVRVTASAIIPATVIETWSVVRSFGNMGAWMSAGVAPTIYSTAMMFGHHDTELGATRVLKLGGDGILCEQLTGLDDEELRIKWKLVSHPYNSNPFPGSFVNYVSAIQLLPVSVGDVTYISWTGEFLTEPEQASHMEAVLRKLYTEGFMALIEHMHQAKVLNLNSVSLNALMGTHKCFSLDRTDSNCTETDSRKSEPLQWCSH